MSVNTTPDLRLVEPGYGSSPVLGEIDPEAVVQSTLLNTKRSLDAMQRLLEAEKRNELLDIIEHQPCAGASFDFPKQNKEDLFWELSSAGFRFCDRYQLYGVFSEREEMHLGRMSYPPMSISGSELVPGRFYGVILDTQHPGTYRIHIGLLGKRDGEYYVQSGGADVFMDDGMALLARNLFPQGPTPPDGPMPSPIEDEEYLMAA